MKKNRKRFRNYLLKSKVKKNATTDPNTQNQPRLGFIISYIRKNLHQKITIDQISKLAFVSKSNFFKIFKQEVGISPNEFILQERIKQAKELLKNRESIKNVAYQTGFSDTNYFTRAFRQIVGTTPKHFQTNFCL